VDGREPVCLGGVNARKSFALGCNKFGCSHTVAQALVAPQWAGGQIAEDAGDVTHVPCSAQ
jgi:hypothetical protein